MENEDKIQETVQRLSEKARSLYKRIGEQEEEIKKLSASRSDCEVRLKVLESGVERMSEEVSDFNKKLGVFELNHNSRKEKWNTAINFIVQLAWVAMAAFLLNRLGLQAPL